MNKNEILSIISMTCKVFNIPKPDRIRFDSKDGRGYCLWRSDGTKHIQFPKSFIDDDNPMSFNDGAIMWTILHEIAHLVYPQHDSKFKKLEDELMKYWKVSIKRQVDNGGAQDKKHDPHGLYPTEIYYNGKKWWAEKLDEIIVDYKKFVL